MNKIEYVPIEATLLNFTDGERSAVLLLIDEAEHWIPRSTLSYRSDQLINEDNLGEAYVFQVAKWKAVQEGIY